MSGPTVAPVHVENRARKQSNRGAKNQEGRGPGKKKMEDKIYPVSAETPEPISLQSTGCRSKRVQKEQKGLTFQLTIKKTVLVSNHRKKI